MNQQFKGYPFEAKRYPASLPPLKGGVDPKRRPVVVVGEAQSAIAPPSGSPTTACLWFCWKPTIRCVSGVARSASPVEVWRSLNVSAQSNDFLM